MKGAIVLAVVLAGSAASGIGAEIPFRAGNWPAESGLGNHRAVIAVKAPADAVRVRIPWRRRDPDPGKINVIIAAAATGKRIANVFPLDINRESGEFIFQPSTGPGDYYAYYMPYGSTGRSNYPTVRYDPPEYSPDPAWLIKNGLSRDRASDAAALPEAETVEIQSIDEWNSFFPMEVIATEAETRRLLETNPEAAYLLFPEDRGHSIRMPGDLPSRWIRKGPGGEIRGEAARGEYFAFQIGVWAARVPIEDVDVRFSDLIRSPDATKGGPPVPGTIIGASAISCFNKGGINWDGAPFAKAVPIARGTIQALWCGIDVPPDARPGNFKGKVVVTPKGLPGTALPVEIRVTDEKLADHGDGDPSRMSRLRWLDSRLASDDGVVPPFTPMTVDGTTIDILGRDLTIGRGGLPARVRSRFAPEMTRLSDSWRDILAAPMRLVVMDGGGELRRWDGPAPRITGKSAGAVTWEAASASGALKLECAGRMEFDGFVDLRLALRAERDTPVEDVVLEIPFAGDAARYMMGLGFKGGIRPREFSWAWDRTKNQDALWIGDVNAGLQVSLRAENYSRPLNTNFYLSKPLNMPPSWENGGRGKVRVREEGGSVLVSAAGGPRTLRAGETLHFDVVLLVTPFKTIDPAAHFAQRYYHAFKPLDDIAAAGANVINVHHATAINPYINYPFLRAKEMKDYVDAAHVRGFKVKIYDTIRELSNRASELFALRSLGHEGFSPGPGGGFSWLQEHVGGDYIAAWFVPELADAAIINSGMSRWHNYYVEGLNWLAANVGIDGLYLDDVAFDRTTMKRARKVLDRNRPGALIDLHSANQYNPRDGFASSANLYLEHFPFLNRLWFGEYFDYGSEPDYWLVEMSGIPFGLMGEMLQDGGNPWRGMLFGMTNRLPWAGDPRPLWKAWDDFGITDARMIGFWVGDSPVRTDNEQVPATAYTKKGKALISLASWAGKPVDVRLKIDWKALGIDPNRAIWTAPAIDGFQEARAFAPGSAISVTPGKGLLLVIEEKS
jgi:hypothetical protein